MFVSHPCSFLTNKLNINKMKNKIDRDKKPQKDSCLKE